MEKREMLELMTQALDELKIEYDTPYKDLPQETISEILKEHSEFSEFLYTIIFDMITAGHRFKVWIKVKKIGIYIMYFSGVYLDKKKKLSQQVAILLKIAQLNAHTYSKYGVDREDGEINAQASLLIGENGSLTMEQCKLALVLLDNAIEKDWSEIMATYFFDPERYLDMGQSSEAPPEKPDPGKE